MFNIYVGNLPFDTTESEIHDLFSAHGEVEAVNIITDRDTAAAARILLRGNAR